MKKLSVKGARFFELRAICCAKYSFFWGKFSKSIENRLKIFKKVQKVMGNHTKVSEKTRKNTIIFARLGNP
jgi:hypothetical protein